MIESEVIYIHRKNIDRFEEHLNVKHHEGTIVIFIVCFNELKKAIFITLFKLIEIIHKKTNKS